MRSDKQASLPRSQLFRRKCKLLSWIDIGSYDPLNPCSSCIRLMTLLSGGPYEDPIRVIIETISLETSSPPQYEALSYVWGPQEGPGRIIGQEWADREEGMSAGRDASEGQSIEEVCYPLRYPRTSPKPCDIFHLQMNHGGYGLTPFATICRIQMNAASSHAYGGHVQLCCESRYWVGYRA